MKTKLREVVKEYSVRNKSNGNLRVYSVTNSNGFIPSTEYFSKEVFSKNLSTYKIVERGMIAYNPSRINVGSVACQNKEDKVIVSPLYVVVKVDTSILLPQILELFLKSEIGLKQIKSLTSGSVRDSLKYSALERIEINIPRLEDQRKILENFSKLSVLISKREQQLYTLESLAKSRFIEMFGEKDFPKIKIGNEFLTTSGGTPSSKNESYYKDGTIPWLTSGEVNKGIISVVERNITKLGLENSTAKIIPANCVVVAMYGATAGKVGLLRIKASTNQAVCAILPNEEYNPIYLYYAISQKEKWMISQTHGGAQPNISQNIIKNMEILKPPISLQNEYANTLQQLDKSKFRIKKSLEKLELTYKALLQEYFG